MTGEQIVGISTEDLEAMSDEQLLEFFKDILPITRPQPKTDKPEDAEDDDTDEATEMPKVKRQRKSKSSDSDMSEMMAQLVKLAAEKGIKI